MPIELGIAACIPFVQERQHFSFRRESNEPVIHHQRYPKIPVSIERESVWYPSQVRRAENLAIGERPIRLNPQTRDSPGIALDHVEPFFARIQPNFVRAEKSFGHDADCALVNEGDVSV